jgi:hypothetical protein
LYEDPVNCCGGEEERTDERAGGEPLRVLEGEDGGELEVIDSHVHIHRIFDMLRKNSTEVFFHFPSLSFCYILSLFQSSLLLPNFNN